jgi:hypothetical protein
MGIGKVLAAAAALAVAAPASAQVAWQKGDQGWCEQDGSSRNRERVCEVRTATVAAPARVTVDGGANGGVTVTGWDRKDVQIEAQVWADARTEDRAREMVGATRIAVNGGRISADGPDRARRESWGVSYRIMVPRAMDLDVETTNGGVSITDVAGDIRFSATNGGVHLNRLAGDVRGHTTNGGLTVELAGDHWDGAGLDATTTNGGVNMVIPGKYSAELVTGTVNGGISVDFPVTVRGHIGRELRTTLGNGGATLRVRTTNGGVRITRG